VTEVTTEALSTDLHKSLQRLRRESPVAWMPNLDAWLVTSHQHCSDVMLDSRVFTVDDSGFSTGQVIGPSMLSLDGEDHRRHREPFRPPFRASRIRDLEEKTRREAKRLVDGLRDRGSGDLRASIAAPLALITMTEILDLDDVDADDILQWYREIVDAVHAVTVGDDVPESGHRAFAELSEAVAASAAKSELLAPIERDGRLMIDEIVSNVAVLLFGGIVTTEASAAIAFRYLLDDPDLRRRVDADRSLVAPFVEETLRLEPSASVVDRYATTDVRLAGAAIGEGDLVRVSLSGANRDPDVFPGPDDLDLTRRNSHQTLTFARGPHSCLGIHLARLEVTLAVEAILDGLPGLEAGELDPIEGLVFRAPATVMAVWPGSEGLAD
jgi:cytochrome P450